MADVRSGREVDLAVEPQRPEASLGQLVSEMTSELGTLLRQEVELAKVETKEEVGRAARAGGMLGAGGLAAWFGLLFASLALAWLLDQAMNRALAFVIVGAAWLLVGAVLFIIGRRRMREVEPLPQTMESLKEDVAWVKAQKS
jgi:uncharacterized membrane protein YqjE